MPRAFGPLLLLVALLGPRALGNQCYSCAGTCHREPCNCQMGSCESNYCFIERKPTEVRGVHRITKGCVKNPARTRAGCDFDHFPDHIQCICSGNFCNDIIFLRPAHRHNVTCRQCSERNPDCSETCQGQWCHEDSTTGASGCGYGPPSLPYFYKGPELLRERNKVCITMSRGNGKPRRHCICNTNMCNDFHRYYPYQSSGLSSAHRSRSLSPQSRPLQKCVSCDVSAQDNVVTPSCKQHTCIGHYCTYATQRVVLGIQATINEKQGCINVTDHSQIQLGCTHKWMDEFEELFCACEGDMCNRDLSTASRSGVLSLRIPFVFLALWTVLEVFL
ncbi:hypothetical protein QR680_005251 [Steinernema hermaphroditum]|uniref:Uncharacterized protein n=1 Tax=Steinernema hermaphroditum TaxID=289476 RepID=A0AA39LVB2_9BILA|nr:hypothetical protein QR680_005251 [Steinernema hermaphroditum]